jgi:L-lactate dehydrogenase (cytochrome)
MFYDYCEAGHGPEQTFHGCVGLLKFAFRQRIAVDMTNRTTASQMIGRDVAMPVAGPTSG